MNKIWYISPSNQGANVGVGNYGTEREQMYLLAEAIAAHLDRAGVSFVIPEKTATLPERVAQSNTCSAWFHLALHSNAGGGGKARGPVAFYYSESGKQFCQSLVDALLELGQESNRSSHVIQNMGLYELRRTVAPAALLEVDFHDNPDGVAFITTRRSEIAEAIAKTILGAEGKEFVPVTAGEYVEQAVSLGLFPGDTDWAAPMTKKDAAILAAKIAALAGKGVWE